MQNKYGTPNCNNIFEFISILTLLISYILFVYQSFLNYHFINNSSREIIAEKILYKHFSEEIYSNIKMKLLKNITIKEKEEDISNISTYLNLEVKLESYFDCRGETNGLLNEKECQDKIVSNLTCCRSECCTRINESIKCNNYNFDLKRVYNNNTILNYNEEEKIEDPRRRFCKFFNVYNNSTSKVLNISLKVEEDYDYQYFIMQTNDEKIKVSTENIEGFTDCGELDSLNNHLFVKDRTCPINYIIRGDNKLYFDSINSIQLYPKKMIVRNILSEIPPNIHEWNNYNYENIDDNIITIKDVNKIINENESYYEKQDAYFYINEISDLYDKYKDKVNRFQKLYWYTNNYIGFKNKDEFMKFEKIFRNTQNNPLYNISSSNNIYPSIISGVFGILLIIFCLIYIILFLISLKIDFMTKKPLFIVKEIIILISIIIGIILLLFSPMNKFESIDIIMDKHYREILDLYNRRKSQKYLLTSFIIIIFVLLYEIYFIFFARNNLKNNKIIDKGSDSESINNIKDENRRTVRQEQIYYRDGNGNDFNSGRRPILKGSRNVIKGSINSNIKSESLNINNQ